MDEPNPRPCLWWPIRLFKEPVFGPIRWPSATANLAACLTANLVPCPIDGGGDFSCWPIGAILLLNIQLPKPCEAEVDQKLEKQVPWQAVWSCAWKLSGGRSRSSAQCSNREAYTAPRDPSWKKWRLTYNLTKYYSTFSPDSNNGVRKKLRNI